MGIIIGKALNREIGLGRIDRCSDWSFPLKVGSTTMQGSHSHTVIEPMDKAVFGANHLKFKKFHNLSSNNNCYVNPHTTSAVRTFKILIKTMLNVGFYPFKKEKLD